MMPETISYKRLAKLPRVVLEGDMLGKIKRWFFDNGISPMVPPIFNRFVIEYTSGARMSVPVSKLGLAAAWGFVESDDAQRYPSVVEFPRQYEVLERHVWTRLSIPVELLVEYDSALTVMYVTAYEDGIRSIRSRLDYSEYDGETGSWPVRAECTEKFSEEWVAKNCNALRDQLMSAIAVQNYILYHRSEEIAEPRVIHVASGSSDRKLQKKGGKKSLKKAVNIRHQKRKTIIIREGEPLPRRAYNYRTLAWNVRGHYSRRGADKHLVYIAPYICRRGDEKKKPQSTIYRITEGDKK